MTREEQERLYKIRELEQTPHRGAQMIAQVLKRRSSISFSDEGQRIPERSKYIVSEPLDLSGLTE